MLAPIAQMLATAAAPALAPARATTRDERTELADILAQPGVTPAVDRTFPLEEAADGVRALVSGQVCGKLVLRVAG